MIEYEEKTITNKFKINNDSYDITIDLKYADDGPKVDIKVDSDTSFFNMKVVGLDVSEVQTVFNEVVTTLAALTHVHYPTPPVGPAPAMTPAPAPAPGVTRSTFTA